MAKAHVNGLAGAGAQDNELSGTLEAFADALAAAPHASALRYLSLSGNRFEGGAPAGLSRIAAFKPGPWRAPGRAHLPAALAAACSVGCLAAPCRRPGDPRTPSLAPPAEAPALL